jgi:hypothetical protein
VWTDAGPGNDRVETLSGNAILPDKTGDFYRDDDRADLTKKIREWTQTPFAAPAVSRACRELVRRRYSPEAQRQVIDAAIDGESADGCCERGNVND